MANEYGRKEYDGGSIRTTLAGSLTSNGLTATVADGSTLPAGTYPFVMVIGRGTATEEKILVESRSAETLTILQRGYDGSTAQAHSAGEYVEHALDAYTLDQANAIATTMTTAGDLLYKTTTGENVAFSRLAIGASGNVLKSNGSAPSWGKVTASEIQAATITGTELAGSVAGSGLTGGAGSALAVNVDNSTLEVNTDIVRVKASGITANEIAAGAVGSSELATDAVTATAIAAGAVGSSELATDSVTADKIAAGAVGNSELASSAVDNGKVASGSFTNILNTKLADYAGKAAASGTQSINNATDTAVTLAAADIYDYASAHNPSSNSSRVYLQANGVYHFAASLGYAAASGGLRNLVMKRYNSSGVEQELVAVSSCPGIAGEPVFLAIAGTCSGVAGDYVELRTSQSSGGPLSTYHSGGFLSVMSWECIRLT